MVYYFIIAALALCFMLPALASLKRRRRYAVIARADEEDLQLNVVSLAQSMTVRDKTGAGIPYRETMARIRRAFRLVKRKVKDGYALEECEKWLYENGNFLLTNAYRTGILRLNALPRSGGKIRAVALAHLLTSLDRCVADADKCARQIKLFNKYAPLTGSEVFSLPAAFAYSLLRHIARMCSRIILINKAEKYAGTDDNFDISHAKLPGYTYYSKLLGKLSGEERTETGTDNAEITFGVYLSDTAVLLSNAVKSLKSLPDTFNLPFMLGVSPAGEIFSRDETYRSMDDISKRLYLDALGALAEYANMSERYCAEQILLCSRVRGVHFGELLFESRRKIYRLLKGKKTSLYGGENRAAVFGAAVFALDLAISCAAAVLMNGAALSVCTFFAVFFIAFRPIEYLAVKTVSAFLPRRSIPRLKLNSIPEQGRILTVMSAVLSNEAEARAALENIKSIRAANRDDNAGFVLLADFRPSDSEREEGDDRIIRALSAAEGESDIFVLVRKRSKCGKTWSGRERKRGAIEDMNSLLLRGDKSPFEYISRLPFTPVYVLLLDSDSILTVGGVRRAVSAAMHPLAKKYDILSFGCKYKLSSLRTPYSVRYLHESGVEEYCGYSDFYYNLCSQSVFCGKGIYNLRPFDEKLKGALPEGRVLSHDIAEGALTVCGSAGDFVYEDAPPAFAPQARRLERWQRGDLLLLPLAFRRKCHPLYRYIILRNIVAIFAAPTAFAAVIAVLATGNIPLAIVTGVCLMARPLAEAGFSLYSLAEGVRTRYAVGGFLRSIAYGIEDIILLPFNAFSGLAVVIKTLFRLVTHKNLLEWRTFASTLHDKCGAHFAQISGGAFTLAVLAATLYFSVAVPVYAAVCVIYACLLATGGIEFAPEKAGVKDKAFLRGVACDTYAYFTHMRGQSKLISDNLAFETGVKIAGMTSPTNLGMGILSHVCAAECGIIEDEEAVLRIARDVNVLEGLPVWKGNFFNWYDLDGKVKRPEYVSSVDNGNLAACLITARAFLKKRGERLPAIDRILGSMRLEELFDRSNGRFFIGYNLESGTFEGHYDMMASEARILAYIAACSANIPAWDGLRRDLISACGNMLVSWAGTAFEYLMPQIFFEDNRFSLLTHSCRGACAVMRASSCRGVFGISESGCYDFDDGGNYRYGQFGVSTLALKSTADMCVISPYSSAMMLKYMPKKAVENLKKLKKRGVYGKFGFFEAIDYTAGGRIVCSYMSHHQGMLLAAVTNAMKDNVISRYFMSGSEMRGGALLLQERVPEIKCAKKPKADFVYPLRTEFFRRQEGISQPKAALLSAGEYSVALSESGCSVSRWKRMDINRWRKDPSLPDGGFFTVKSGSGEFSPTYMPGRNSGDKYAFSYTPEYCEYENLSQGCSQKVFLLTGIAGEMRKLTIKNTTEKVATYEISYYERLAMADGEEYASHPVYADMFVGAEKDGEAVFITKRAKSAVGDRYMAFRLFGGGDTEYSCSAADAAGKGKISPSFGDVMYPCLNAVCRIAVSPGESRDIYVVKAVDTDREKIKNFMEDMDGENYFGYCEKCAGLSSLRTRRYRAENEVNELLDVLAPQLLYATQSAEKIHYYNLAGTVKIFALDYEKDFSMAERAISAVLYLNLCGLKCKLHIVLSTNDEYYAQKRDRLLHNTRMGNIEKLDIVHITDIDEFATLIRSKPVFFLDEMKKRRRSDDKENACRAGFRKAVCEHTGKPEKLLESGFGYFTAGGDYVVTSPPLLPYSNVVADERGGFVITENGGGFTFSSNSCENKVSVWFNDPVEDSPSETLTLFTGEKYLRLNKLQPGGYVRHSRGATYFVCRAEGLDCMLSVGIIKRGLGKIYRLKLANTAQTNTDIKLVFDIKPLLGRLPHPSAVDVRAAGDGIVAENSVTGQKAYVSCLQGAQAFCRQSYACAVSGERLYPVVSDINVCLARLVAHCVLPAGEEKVFDFLITESEELFASLKAEDVLPEMEKQADTFKSLNKVSVEGVPEEEKLFLENLPYQVYSSRLKGRCGFYQAGGAVGFRDQLQDCLAHLYADPAAVRAVILECAARQYEEGDVMHWWHRPNLGVRTGISDDRLFLGYVTAEYIEFTGDKDVMNEQIPYLSSPPLAEGEDSRMERGLPGRHCGSLTEHILRAVDSLGTGEHGLLLIGGGDWNDALNGIGVCGRGESVWLTQFAAAVIDKILPYLDAGLRSKYIRRCEELKEAVNSACFDGKYARAFTDDGIWLGRDNSPCCSTDIICQAWAVISGIASKEGAKTALAYASKLIDDKFGVVRLLEPPFNKDFYCGYISAYPEGVRENGGQYTHAAVWLFKAFCMVRDAKNAARLARILNPVYHCESEGRDIYCGEPYVIAADVYYNDKMKGRMGWSWYTGSAGWYFRTYLEDYLGFRIRSGAIECSRPLAENWRNILITYRHGGARFRIRYAEGENDCIEENGVKMTGVPVNIDRPGGEYDVTFIFKKNNDRVG